MAAIQIEGEKNSEKKKNEAQTPKCKTLEKKVCCIVVQ